MSVTPTSPPPNNDPPPVYSTSDVEKNSPPPTYDSIFGKLKQAKDGSSGKADFCFKFFAILSGSLICSICLGLMLGIPISMIVMGAIYLDDCPAQRMIPIFLIVHGVFNTFSFLGSIVKSAMKKKDDDEEEKKRNPIATCIDSLVNTFLVVWFICGNVWTYGTKDWVRSPTTASNYCDPKLYYFSFWVITSTYILIGVMCVGLCTCIICLCVCSKKK